MFTGHIREIGSIDSFDGTYLRVRVPENSVAITAGDSVCVSGIRLTVRDVAGQVFGATVAAETTRRSTFDALATGDPVNVELPLAAGSALNGHLVQGYADGVGKVARTDCEGDCLRIWIRPPQRLMARLVAKTPIAVDGVSLAIAERLRDRFCVVVVPATRAATTLDRLAPGTRVNLELDVVSRLATSASRPGPGQAGPGQAGRSQPGRSQAAALSQVIAQSTVAGTVSGRASLDQVLTGFAGGGAVVVWDPHTEGEGDVIFAGARLRPGAFTFLLTEACGHTTVPCAAEILDRLDIGPIPGPGDRHGTACHIPVDLAAGTGTGVSAAERAATVRRLAHPQAVAQDFLRPGHVHPLRARPGLLAERVGHTEATVALCVAAGLPPVGVCCEVMNRDGTMAGAADLETAALRWGLPLIEITDLRAWL